MQYDTSNNRNVQLLLLADQSLYHLQPILDKYHPLESIDKSHNNWHMSMQHEQYVNMTNDLNEKGIIWYHESIQRHANIIYMPFNAFMTYL